MGPCRIAVITVNGGRADRDEANVIDGELTVDAIAGAIRAASLPGRMVTPDGSAALMTDHRNGARAAEETVADGFTAVTRPMLVKLRITARLHATEAGARRFSITVSMRRGGPTGPGADAGAGDEDRHHWMVTAEVRSAGANDARRVAKLIDATSRLDVERALANAVTVAVREHARVAEQDAKRRNQRRAMLGGYPIATIPWW